MNLPILTVPYKWPFKPPIAEIGVKGSNSTYVPATDPIAHGLVYAPLLSEGAGSSAYDPVSMINGTIAGADRSWTIGPFGPALKISNIQYGTTDHIDSNSYYGNTTNWTMSAWTSPSVLIDCGTLMVSGNVHGAALYFGYGGSGTIAVNLSGVAWCDSGFLYPDLAPNWHHVCVTCAMSNLLSLYFDGRLIASGFNSGHVADYVGGNLLVGNAAFQNVAFYGSVDLPRYWVRELSAAEVMREYTDPLWIYRAPASHQFYPMSGVTDNTEGPIISGRQMIENW